MGRIKRFNLGKLINVYGAEYFFETGTWRGDGLAYAARYPFKKLYSTEIIESVADRAKQRFANDSRVEIITDASTTALEKYSLKIPGACVFWLDAHFPGAEEGLKDYNEYEDETIKLPLRREMEIISARKNKHNDIILVDDLRIYEEGNYESGNLPGSVLPPKVRNTDFAFELFTDTHTIDKSLRDEGYLILLPKKSISVPIFKNLLFSLENKVFKKIL